jgi:hypothetical protein
MKPTRKPPSKHDWLQKTHTSEISTWDLNQCIAFLSLSECTQIKKLPGGGTATESKELVHKQLMSLIRSENDKPTPNAVAKVNDEKEEIDFTAIVYALSLQQCFIDRAFPLVKLPQVMISSAYGSKDKVLHDIANLHQNALLLIQMLDQYNNNGHANRKSNNQDDNDDIASIVSQRQ